MTASLWGIYALCFQSLCFQSLCLLSLHLQALRFNCSIFFCFVFKRLYLLCLLSPWTCTLPSPFILVRQDFSLFSVEHTLRYATLFTGYSRLSARYLPTILSLFFRSFSSNNLLGLLSQSADFAPSSSLALNYPPIADLILFASVICCWLWLEICLLLPSTWDVTTITTVLDRLKWRLKLKYMVLELQITLW